MKKQNWFSILFSFVGRCKGKMLMSVITAIISVIGGVIPYIAGYHIIILFATDEPNKPDLIYWCAVCIGGYVVKLIFYAISTTLSHVSAYTILEEIRLRIADKLMRAPLGEVLNRTMGSIKNIFVDKVEEVEHPLAHMIPEGISNLFLPIILFVYLVTIDYRMALATIATIPLAAIPFMSCIKNYSSQYENYMKANTHVNSIIVEYIEGIEVVKAFNQTTSSYEKFVDAVSSFKEFTLAWFQGTWRTMNLTFAILPTTLLGVVPVGIALYIYDGFLPSDLTMCMLLALGIIAPIMKFSLFLNEGKNMQYAVMAADELLSLPELPDCKDNVRVEGYDISFDGVDFSYTGKDKNKVLSNINLHIDQGTFNALVGPSGGGKSTFAKLIARFFDVTAGSISIGGTDIRDIPLSQLSKIVSFVTQDNYLFDCSIKENIRLGNSQASDEEVFAAAKAACCDEFIRKLDNGYDTSAGSAGNKLSGGEKQRISIARAFLKDAPIVILDEATAFTDPENESKIHKSIKALSKGKTLLIIAHRLSTIKNADQIVVLEKGNVVKVGTQKELLVKCPLYKKMWEAHVGAQRWAVSGRKESVKKGMNNYV